ncbi:MAG: hypothetical protein IPM21_10675 [Acidobacteria bacterium]|nr:hypothetical protein [Acidobacteriota bacterium]
MRSLALSIIRLITLSALVVLVASGNTVTLDTTFNNTGYRLETVGTEQSTGHSLAIQSDGKTIVAGMTRTAAQTDQFVLIRLNADGSLDTSFGDSGTAYSPKGVRAVGWSPKVLIQPDGKILLGVTAWLTQQQTYVYMVIRYTHGGVLDLTFNNIGYATANVPNSFWDICHSMALGSDGKIVLVGTALPTPGQMPDWDVAVVRFNSNGSIDPAFDTDGIVRLGNTIADEEAFSVMIQPDGKIVVGGRETTDREKFLLTRLNVDGSVDTSFGTNGWNIFQIDFSNNNYTSLARQSDGKLLAGGGGKIMRFSLDGVRDLSFATNGLQSNTGTIERVDIHVLPNDKFLVATRYGVSRFMSEGAVDTHYSTQFRVSGHICFTRSVAVQSDGKAVPGGWPAPTATVSTALLSLAFRRTAQKGSLISTATN